MKTASVEHTVMMPNNPIPFMEFSLSYFSLNLLYSIAQHRPLRNEWEKLPLKICLNSVLKLDIIMPETG